MTRKRGLTLLELMISLGMSVLLIGGIAGAFTTAIDFDKQNGRIQAANEATITFEQRIRALLVGAYVSSSTTDSLTYFLGMTSGNNADSTLADTLTFTTLTGGVNPAALNSDDDFETLNQSFGPQGGIAEVSISSTAVGEQGQSKEGLFLRIQRPADGDPTQGGNEAMLNADIRSMTFEFYNGTDWDPVWSTSGLDATATANLQNDTQTGQDGRRIPAAVRVTYSLNADADGVTHVFVVRLPQSDVTTENPVTQTATGTPGGTP